MEHRKESLWEHLGTRRGRAVGLFFLYIKLGEVQVAFHIFVFLDTRLIRLLTPIIKHIVGL